MLTLNASIEDAGARLDRFVHERFADSSRSRVQAWIRAGRVLVNGKPAKPSLVLKGGEQISVEPAAPPPLKAFPEDLPLTILYEDQDVVAVDKPAGMVVHLGAGHHAGTLVNALLHRFQSGLSTVSGETRPGVVHRLDRSTSGVLLVARTDAAHRALAAQFSRREVEKTYLALVCGAMPAPAGRIELPIERDPVRRTRMTARTGRGRAALTLWRVLARFQDSTYLEVDLKTGRTHQIRVHLSAIGHPLVGDPLYGGPKGPGRCFLHAHRIVFTSPSRGERITVVSPLAPDLAALLEVLGSSGVLGTEHSTPELRFN